MVKKSLFFILLLLASYPAVCAILITPALPQLSTDLHLTKGTAQLLVAVFLVGYTFGFLPYGPLANRFGRRPVAVYAVTFALAGAFVSIVGAYAKNIYLLYLGRLVCGLGSSVGLKMAFTYISELFPVKEIAGRIAYMSLSFAIGPAISVVIGGWLTSFLGGNACFIMIFTYSLLILYLTGKLPETLQEQNKTPLILTNIFNGYASKFSNKVLVIAAMLLGSSTSFVYCFASFAPFLAIKHIGLTPEQYGSLNFIPPIGMISGFFINQYMKSRLKPITQLKLGISITGGFSLLMYLFFVFGVVNPYSLFLFIPGVYLGTSIVFANSSSLALGSDKNKSNASAIISFINMFFCSAVLFLSERSKYDFPSFLPLVFIILTLGMIILWNALKKTLKDV